MVLRLHARVRERRGRRNDRWGIAMDLRFALFERIARDSVLRRLLVNYADRLDGPVDRTVVSRSCELEDLEGSVHDAAGLATGFGDVTSAGEVVGTDCEVAQAGHDAGS